jgi:hypothetical protein
MQHSGTWAVGLSDADTLELRIFIQPCPQPSKCVVIHMPQKKEELKKNPPSDLNEGETQEQLSLYVNPEEWPKPLPRFLKRMSWTADKWQEIRKHWLEKPNDLTTRDWLINATAKYERYREAPKIAVERQKSLRPGHWITAFCLAQDLDRTQVASFLRVEVDYVDDLIGELKQIADVQTHAGIVRWFLGF